MSCLHKVNCLWQVARMLIAILWAVCVTFCAGCVILGLFTEPSSGQDEDDSSDAAWVAHATFVVAGGGTIAWLVHVMLSQPELLDTLHGKCFSVDSDQVVGLKSPDHIASKAQIDDHLKNGEGKIDLQLAAGVGFEPEHRDHPCSSWGAHQNN